MMKNEITPAKSANSEMYPIIIREFDDGDNEPMLYRG